MRLIQRNGQLINQPLKLKQGHNVQVVIFCRFTIVVLLLTEMCFPLGEAKYIDDIPVCSNELFGAFVLSTVANCYIDQIDASDALV